MDDFIRFEILENSDVLYLDFTDILFIDEFIFQVILYQISDLLKWKVKSTRF